MRLGLLEEDVDLQKTDPLKQEEKRLSIAEKRLLALGDVSVAKGKITTTKKSLVEIFNLTHIVKEMRMKGKSYKDIADNINKSNLIPNGYTISYVAVARWCKNNNLAGDVNEYDGEEAVNVYLQQTKALNLINSAIDLVSVQMDEMNKKIAGNCAKVKDIKDLIDSLDKLTVRQQNLCSGIAAIQDRVYRYETVARVVGVILTKISMLLPPEDYEEIKKELSSDPILREAIREIKPSGV